MLDKVLLIFCCLIILPIHGERYAILIGNEEGTAELNKLKYVQNDIEDLGEVLKKHGKFKRNNIRTVINEDKEEIISEIEDILKEITEEDILLFYYSGHSDNQNLLIENEKLSLKFLKDLLSTSNANINITVFDACQSGSFSQIKGGTISKPFLFENTSKVKGNILLYSSSENEFSQELNYYQNSVFTFHLVNALKGLGDSSGDNKVTIEEAYRYAYNQTIMTTAHSLSGVQHPGYMFDIQGEGDVILSDLTEEKNIISLDAEIDGVILFIDKRRDIVAELTKKIGKNIKLSLPTGKYTVILKRDSQTFKSELHSEKGISVLLRNQHFRPIKENIPYFKGLSVNKKNLSVHLSVGLRRYGYNSSTLADKHKDLTKNLQLFNLNTTSNGLPRSTYFSEIAFTWHLHEKYSASLIGGYSHVNKNENATSTTDTETSLHNYSSTSTNIVSDISIGYYSHLPLINNSRHRLVVTQGFVGSSYRNNFTISLTDHLFDAQRSFSQNQKQISIENSLGISYTFYFLKKYALSIGGKYTHQLFTYTQNSNVLYYSRNDLFISFTHDFGKHK